MHAVVCVLVVVIEIGHVVRPNDQRWSIRVARRSIQRIVNRSHETTVHKTKVEGAKLAHKKARVVKMQPLTRLASVEELAGEAIDYVGPRHMHVTPSIPDT